jgi:hypothetical protein
LLAAPLTSVKKTIDDGGFPIFGRKTFIISQSAENSIFERVLAIRQVAHAQYGTYMYKPGGDNGSTCGKKDYFTWPLTPYIFGQQFHYDDDPVYNYNP